MDDGYEKVQAKYDYQAAESECSKLIKWMIFFVCDSLNLLRNFQ